MAKLLLTDDLRTQLKNPLGELVRGDVSECVGKLREVQEGEKPVKLILVGDSISRTALQSGIKPDVIVVDRLEKREEVGEFDHGMAHIFRTRNNSGTIDLMAWNAIAEAVERGNSIVIVDGEEDLLTLAAIMVAPVGSVVGYGQPNEGIVLVRVSNAKKDEIGRMLDSMKRVD